MTRADICHSGGSWPTLIKEGAFEGSKRSAFKDGSLGYAFGPRGASKTFPCRSFPSIVCAWHVSQASREGDRGRLASFAGLACWKLASPNEVGLIGAGSDDST